ncbi:uncharacterized protein TNCV_2692751 [Trichonephila clavipes]|uniref:Uncharacterized protein n=1 Tax=Trichonephila clavipes TaxID=2585209 RepID=A0A8X7BBV4_TRICX|nr:uncharacterized protein TNCV_2692751 [Trichonephila clavipes]
MQYLLQSVEPHSKAERLVLSFPATAANYSKAIEQLKERFCRDDLLVQIYVRDLLGLVTKNAVKGRLKTDLPYLYDELEGKLRAFFFRELRNNSREVWIFPDTVSRELPSRRSITILEKKPEPGIDTEHSLIRAFH